jgi:hypothetical protein
MRDQSEISDEYINSFFERVQYKHAPGPIVWHRADGFNALLRGTWGSIEIGWESVQDSRTDEPNNVGPLLVGSMWFTGDIDEDAEQFLDLMAWWAIHEAAEQVTLDGSLVTDPHDVDADGNYFGKAVNDARQARWGLEHEEALA